MLRGAAAGFRLELQLVRSIPDSVLPLATVPLFTIVFLAILDNAGRADVQAYAVLAPALIAVWWLALSQAGTIVQRDRTAGILELTLASPASLAAVVVGRVCVVTLLGLTAFAESWAVGRASGADVHVAHPAAFALTLAATAIAAAGTAVVIAAVFVLTRYAATLQNSLSYPFYVLGGVFVPVSFLPDYVRPLSSVVFLSWSADLLRASVREPPVDGLGVRLAVVVGLGAIGFAVGGLVLARVLRTVRATGEVAFS